MKKIFLICLSIIIIVEISHAQTITLLPLAGVQTTISKVEGSTPVLSTNRQFKTNFSTSLRAYLDNNKGHGLFFGISSVNNGISIKAFDINSISKMSSSSTMPRIELGYQFLSKPIYFNSILKNQIEKNNINAKKGLFFQLQPMAGLGYNFIGNNRTGSIGGGSTTLTDIGSTGSNFSFLTGGNLYIGKNDKQWFFISVMKNWNFGGYTSQARFNSQYNGNFYQNNIKSFGSGTTYSIGIPIRIGLKRSR